MPTLTGVVDKGRFREERGVRNGPVPGSVEIQSTRCRGATMCDKYMFIYLIQNILRISKALEPGSKPLIETKIYSNSPPQNSPVVSAIMRRLNHHAIDNGDVEVYPSDIQFESNTE